MSLLVSGLPGVVDLAVGALRRVPGPAWEGRARGLEWDRRETIGHLTNALFWYAVQLAPRTPLTDRRLPIVRESRRDGGPVAAIHVDRSAEPADLLTALEAAAGLLGAILRTTPPTVRAHHVWGASDAEGFAAMGIVETSVHTHDLVDGLGIPWTPPDDLVAAALARLFPDVPAGDDPWQTLLWATGRTELPGRPRRTDWRWHSIARS